jgi:hypothetical protein
MLMLASDFDKSKYLRAEDLKQDKKFRIRAVTGEVFEKDSGTAEKKLVLWFTNDERGLPLNKTNNRTLRGAYGDDTANSVGKVIVVFPTMADFRGKMTPALRVRIPPPKQATAAAATPAPQQPAPSDNGAAAAPAGIGAAAVPLAVATAAAPLAAAASAAADPELEPDPVKPLRDELDDDLPW